MTEATNENLNAAEQAEQQAEQQAQQPAEQPKTATIQPTIGRKLWYWPLDRMRARVAGLTEGQPYDATVIGLRADGTVNLRITDPMGNTFTQVAVEIAQGSHPSHASDAPEGCATWMPYQAKQAAA